MCVCEYLYTSIVWIPPQFHALRNAYVYVYKQANKQATNRVARESAVFVYHQQIGMFSDKNDIIQLY